MEHIETTDRGAGIESGEFQTFVSRHRAVERWPDRRVAAPACGRRCADRGSVAHRCAGWQAKALRSLQSNLVAALGRDPNGVARAVLAARRHPWHQCDRKQSDDRYTSAKHEDAPYDPITVSDGGSPRGAASPSSSPRPDRVPRRSMRRSPDSCASWASLDSDEASVTATLSNGCDTHFVVR